MKLRLSLVMKTAQFGPITSPELSFLSDPGPNGRTFGKEHL